MSGQDNICYNEDIDEYRVRKGECPMSSKGKTTFVLCLLLCLCTLLPGCGGEEKTPETTDYVYLPESVADNPGNRLSNFCAAGEYLYFFRRDGDTKTIDRIPLRDEQEQPAFSDSETVLKISDILADMSAENAGASGASADILDFTVDEELNLYCLVTFFRLKNNSYEVTDSMLCKRSADGQTVYGLQLQDMEGFQGYGSNHNLLTADREGGVYVLAGRELLLVNRKGEVDSRLPLDITDEYESQDITLRLLSDRQGVIYYTMENSYRYRRETCLVRKSDGKLRAEKVNELSGRLNTSLYTAERGLLVQTDDGLYRYEGAETAQEELLKWQDSNLLESSIQEIVELGADRFLISANVETGQNLSLLTKTAKDQLPEKEQIVIASLFPGEDLKQNVVAFNQASDRYYVTIESYGADPFRGSENEGAYVRLDGSLVAENCPDLLELSGLDIEKYGRAGLLEDLYPYMEHEDIVRKENYPENLLEAYTLEGKLTGIPKTFYFEAWGGADSIMQSLEGWSMEDVIRLTEDHPDAQLLPEFAGGRNYILGTYCRPYYMKKFVDRESGSCSFDSGEFRRLLEWIAAQDKKRENVENNDFLLQSGNYYVDDFDYYLELTYLCGEEAAIVGYPSADKEGVFPGIADDTLGIVSGSRHKEGAWEFLRFYLSDGNHSYFPSRLDLLEARKQELVTPDYILDENGGLQTDQYGEYLMNVKGGFLINGELVPYYVLEQEQADIIMELIESLDFSPVSALEDSIALIVEEEAEIYFTGKKSAEEVCGLIQNRVELLLKENKEESQ